MQTTLNSAAKTRGDAAHAEPVKFQKMIGSTNFVVSVQFSGTSKDTLGDKIIRLIAKEAANQ